MAIPEYKIIEPLKSNRWLIETSPKQINSYLFRKYKMFNEGEKIIFETEFYETVQECYNPQDLIQITDISLKYLSPVGDVVSGFDMIVNGVNFEKKHSYKDDNLLITKLRFVLKQINPIFISKKTED